MKALKAAVILMGVLIVAGLGVIAFTLAKRTASSGDAADAPASGAPSAPSGRGRLPAFGEVGAPVPPGYEVTEMMAEGDRLMLRIEGEGKVPRILVLDLRSGRPLGTVVLDPAMVRPPR